MKIHWFYGAWMKSRAARQWSLLWNTCPAFKQVKTSNLVQFTVYCDWFDEILYLIRMKRTLKPLNSGSVVFLKDLAVILPDQCSKPHRYGFRLLLAQIFFIVNLLSHKLFDIKYQVDWQTHSFSGLIEAANQACVARNWQNENFCEKKMISILMRLAALISKDGSQIFKNYF